MGWKKKKSQTALNFDHGRVCCGFVPISVCSLVQSGVVFIFHQEWDHFTNLLQHIPKVLNGVGLDSVVANLNASFTIGAWSPPPLSSGNMLQILFFPLPSKLKHFFQLASLICGFLPATQLFSPLHIVHVQRSYFNYQSQPWVLLLISHNLIPPNPEAYAPHDLSGPFFSWPYLEGYGPPLSFQFIIMHWTVHNPFFSLLIY